MALRSGRRQAARRAHRERRTRGRAPPRSPSHPPWHPGARSAHDLAEAFDEAIDFLGGVEDVGARANGARELGPRVKDMRAVIAAGDADAEHVAEGAGHVLL